MPKKPRSGSRSARRPESLYREPLLVIDRAIDRADQELDQIIAQELDRIITRAAARQGTRGAAYRRAYK